MAAADVVVGVGPTSTRALVEAGLPADKAETIFNAVDANPARRADDVRTEFGAAGVPLVVNVARYFPEKNQVLLLEALDRLERPFVALLVGQGPIEHELHAAVERLGLGDRDWTLKLIVSSHGHWDHIGDNAAVAGHTGAEVAAHTLDRDRLITRGPCTRRSRSRLRCRRSTSRRVARCASAPSGCG